MKTYKAANVEDAIDLAYELKDKGIYNWFRGQEREEWKPFSSQYRVSIEGDHKATHAIQRRADLFFQWVGKIPELQHLQKTEYTHEFYAILQHYGIPTQYIDFTTDPGVAGFFAAHTPHPPTDQLSCIFCLDKDDLMSIWNIVKDDDVRYQMELVEIDVRNLWRLQAQHGTFLRSTFNWDTVYPMDRIVFPYSGYPSAPTREQVYPEHKSHLEQLLDQFFAWEASVYRGEVIGEMEGSGIIVVRVPEDANNSNSKVVIHSSWHPDTLQQWAIDPEEIFRDTVGTVIRIQTRLSGDIEEMRKSVSFGVRQNLRSDTTIRHKAVDWTLTELPDSVLQEELNRALRPVWNGMRQLPYTDNEIAEALGTTVALLMKGVGRESDYDTQIQMFSQYFGEGICVEFDCDRGGSSRGVADRRSLELALQPDILKLLNTDYKESGRGIEDLFQALHTPMLMFEFNAFRRIFAREIIPSQTVWQRSLLLFNPVQLKTFGIP